MDLTEEQIKQNIEKLRSKVGDARTGGKGSQRRKVKVISKQTGSNNQVTKNLVKKLGAQQIIVQEVNFFKDDNTIMHFKKPQTHAAIPNNTFIVNGQPQTKTIKDLLPDIIQQLGPKQKKLLQDLVSEPNTQDEAPLLVDNETKPNQNAPNLTKPNEAQPNQTKPNEAQPNQTKPDNLDKVQ